MESENYHVGDDVIIYKEGTQVIGKIEDIFINEEGKKLVRYNEYYPPQKTSTGKQDHNSKYELFKTDEIQNDLISNIKYKCEVLKFDFYIKKLLASKDKKHFENVFFVRQKYSVEDDHFAPDLPSTCYCDQILNPDKSFIQCKKCKEYIHLECFLLGETKKCFNSHCNNNIEDQLHVNKGSSTELIGNKRRREEEDVKDIKINAGKDLKENSFSNNNSLIIELSSDMQVSKESDKNVNAPGIGQPAISKPSEDSFPNISEDRRKDLVFLIEKIEKKNLAVNRNISNDEKSRRTIRDRIVNSLLYGIEEIKESKEWVKMKNPELNKSEISEDDAVRVSTNLSVSIETAVFLQNNEMVSNNYKKKLRTIYSNLSDNRNRELRYAILNSDIPPEELVKMQAEELAPSSLKNRRIERQNKYFKEQVLMTEETKIIAKTHKGEAILSLDQNDIGEGFRESLPLVSMNNNTEDNYNYDSDNADNVDKFGSAISDYKQTDKNETETNKFSYKSQNNFNSEFSSAKVSTGSSLLNPSNKKKMIKYKNLSQEQVNFYFLLEDYKKENLISKFNNKLKNHLKTSTYDEIVKLRDGASFINFSSNNI